MAETVLLKEIKHVLSAFPKYWNDVMLLKSRVVEDLVPVCSNCHRMIHREKNTVLTIEELRKIISDRKN